MNAADPNAANESWHSLPPASVADRLRSTSLGLSEEEAARRLVEHGPNTLPERKRRPLGLIFLRQFLSPLIYLLFLAAGIAWLVGKQGDAGVILLVVVVNAVIGVFQEGRAERSMQALRKLSALHVRVLRGGRDQHLAARELVPGDIVLLAAGDAVGADARLLEAAALETAEAALTGESLPVSKHPEPVPVETPLADRRSMIYSGTHVAAGHGRAMVVATGSDTEVGKIASLTEAATEPKTPLELRLAQFGRSLVVVSVALFAVVLGVGLLRGLPFVEVLMVAISQMVSLVPEGLPVAMTIALAVGMQRMAARGAIVRRLSAVETLGSTSVICVDKTGTLTRNEMTVTTLWLPDPVVAGGTSALPQGGPNGLGATEPARPDASQAGASRAFVGGRWLLVNGVGYAPEGAVTVGGEELTVAGDVALRGLLEAGALCNDAQLVPPDQADLRWRVLGDPTEAALLTLALKGGVDFEELRRAQPRRAELPFDAATKMMATQHGHGGTGRVCLKGAPEVVLELCGSVRCERQVLPIGEAFRRAIEAASAQMGAGALRVLAVAEIPRFTLDLDLGVEQLRGQAVFLGLVGQMDPPRTEVGAAVEECQRAGIRPVMVTGDHKATGLAVARRLGIARAGDLAVDGRELEAMPEQDLRHDLPGYSVFARVHPAQKLRIVEAYQARQQVVAMTGDGVNDAPALARADVGVAMGMTGTEVAKGAAKIVITDDNFATIVHAVAEGRLVYQNLKKVILFLFTTSVDEVIVLLLALLLDYPLPLAAVQILWINLVTEGVLTVNLVMEEPEGDEMRRPPIPPSEPLVTRDMLRRMAVMVPASVAATFGFFLWRLSTGVPFALVQSETFTLLAVCQWFNVLNCRSERQSAFNLGVLKNRWLLGGLILGNLLQFAVIYTEPMNRTFHTVPIPLVDFFLIGAVASVVLWAEEIRKLWARRRGRLGTAGS